MNECITIRIRAMDKDIEKIKKKMSDIFPTCKASGTYPDKESKIKKAKQAGYTTASAWKNLKARKISHLQPPTNPLQVVLFKSRCKKLK